MTLLFHDLPRARPAHIRAARFSSALWRPPTNSRALLHIIIIEELLARDKPTAHQVSDPITYWLTSGRAFQSVAPERWYLDLNR